MDITAFVNYYRIQKKISEQVINSRNEIVLLNFLPIWKVLDFWCNSSCFGTSVCSSHAYIVTYEYGLKYNLSFEVIDH